MLFGVSKVKISWSTTNFRTSKKPVNQQIQVAQSNLAWLPDMVVGHPLSNPEN